MLKAIEDGFYTRVEGPHDSLEANWQRRSLSAALRPAPSLRPELSAIYRSKVERLEQAFNDASIKAEAEDPLRSVIDPC
jgi:hypothetical protein